jgi:carbonic anhydrase
MLQSYSAALSEAVEKGRCAIVGVEYTLADGRVSLVDVVGDIGEDVPAAV